MNDTYRPKYRSCYHGHQLLYNCYLIPTRAVLIFEYNEKENFLVDQVLTPPIPYLHPGWVVDYYKYQVSLADFASRVLRTKRRLPTLRLFARLVGNTERKYIGIKPNHNAVFRMDSRVRPRQLKWDASRRVLYGISKHNIWGRALPPS